MSRYTDYIQALAESAANLAPLSNAPEGQVLIGQGEGVPPAFGDPLVTVVDIYAALKAILNLLNRPMWVEPGTGRVRVSDEVVASHAVTLISTTLTSGTLTTLTQLGGFPAKDTLLNHEKKISWSVGVRGRIS